MPESNHILVLPPPEQPGKTYIIGDVHGEIQALTEVIQTLTPYDTLIIVGDLIDRGGHIDNATNYFYPGSKDVLDLLIKHTEAPAGTLPKIYAIRGNHEQNFLKIIDIFEDIILFGVDDYYDQAINMILAYIENGGLWIFDRDDKSQTQKNYYDSLKRYTNSSQLTDRETSQLSDTLNSILDSANPLEELLPQILRYRDFIEKLPFLIKIEGETPILVAHSDLRLGDEEIEQRIIQNKGFSSDEIRYLTCARPRDFQPASPRNQTSHLVVVGHNILDVPNAPKKSSAPNVPVRKETNHVNLDVGAYTRKGFLCFNTTDKHVSIIGSKISVKSHLSFTQWKNQITRHLESIAHLSNREEIEEEEENNSKRPRL